MSVLFDKDVLSLFDSCPVFQCLTTQDIHEELFNLIRALILKIHRIEQALLPFTRFERQKELPCDTVGQAGQLDTEMKSVAEKLLLMTGQIDIAALRLNEKTILSQNAQGIVDPFGTDRIFGIHAVTGKDVPAQLA